jgi:hypothetical protein
LATIASLNVVLSASSVAFSRGMKQGQSALAGFKASIGTATAVLAGFGGALASIAAAKGLTTMVAGTIELVDQLGDTAAQLGITTDALTRLQYAADISGSSAEHVATAIGFLNKNLGQAAAGGAKQTAEALTALGLSARNLASVAPEKAFAEIAEGISKVGNNAERARLAVAIFGKSGQNVLNVLALGRQGLDDAAAASDRFGRTLKQIDAEKVGLADVALKNAAGAVQSLKTALTVELAPYITDAATRFAEMANAGGAGGNAIRAAVEAAAVGTAHLVDLIDLVRAAWNAATGASLKSTAAFLQAINVAGQILDTGLGVGLDAFGSRAKIPNLSPMIDQLNAGAAADFKEMNDLLGRDSSAKAKAFFATIQTGATQAAQAAVDARKATQPLVESLAGGKGNLSLKPLTDGLKAAASSAGGFLEMIGEGLSDILKDALKAPDVTATQFQLPGAPEAVSKNIARGSERASSGVSGKGIDTVAKEAPKQTAFQQKMAVALDTISKKLLPTETVGIP